MGFDLYIVAGTGLDEIQFLLERGFNGLFSQKYRRSAISRWISYADEYPDKVGKLFIDSSAYGAWTQGAEINIDEYIKFLNDNSGKFAVIASLDVIPGTKGEPSTRQQVQEACEKSWENYLYMYDRMIDKNELIPVFHVGEPWDALHRILEYRHADGSPIQYMGLGGLVGVPKKDRVKWLDTVWDIILNSSNPNIKTHAFGVTMIDLLERYPFASADSSSATRIGIVGNIMTSYGVINLSRKVGGIAAFKKLPEEAQEVLIRLIDEANLDITIEELVDSQTYKLMLNYYYLANWAATYNYQGRAQKQRRLF